jgi:hypothetical protein
MSDLFQIPYSYVTDNKLKTGVILNEIILFIESSVMGPTYVSLFRLSFESNPTVHVRFQVLTATSMKFRVFWDVAPCSHVDVNRRFRGSTLTSINFNVTTRRYIPEDSINRVHILRNMISQIKIFVNSSVKLFISVAPHIYRFMN